MILEHVANRTGLFVKLASARDPNLLRHRDLHAGDEIAIPDGLEERVGETEVQQILYGLLAQIVIDAKDAGLGKFLQQRLIQRACGSQVSPERLLDHYA